MSAKRPTQADVAKLAGVSRGTVSIVLNRRSAGRIAISDETRQRVINAASELGYAPNRIDLIMGVPGVDFEESYESRVDEEIDGVRLSFIDLENLRKAKKASGRMQDLADLENLE